MKYNAILVLFAFVTMAVLVSGCFGPLKTTEPVPPTPENKTPEQPQTGICQNADKLDQIKEGLTKQEVLGLGGEPQNKQTVTTAKGNVLEYYYYECGKDVYQVGISLDEVSSVRKY